MDPKALLLLPGLVVPNHQRHSDTLTVRVWQEPGSPVADWPERREPIERGEHPGHGEGSDESPMFIGSVMNTNVASGQLITVDSGASANLPIHEGWLPRGLNLVTSANELIVVEQTMPSPLRSPLAANLDSPNTRRHRGNPSADKIRRTFIKQPR